MHNWKNIVIQGELTLLEVLSIIDEEALRIALVVDEKGQLLGTLTDGDIRRALVEHGNLQISANSVMNRSPIVAINTMSAIEMNALMQERSILAVPIVDNDSRLVGLHTINDLTKGRIKENAVFIMAGGFGTRLKPLTNDCPKPMLEVGGKPILETILENFLEVGFRNFYFSTHYLPEVIEKYFGDGSKFGCSITYIHEEMPLGTGGALGLLPKDLPKGPVIMSNGDILTKVNLEYLLEDHEKKKGIATMCVRQHQYQVPYGVISEEDGKITGVEEKPVQTFFVNAGIYVFEQELLSNVQENTKIDMPPLLMKMVEQGNKVNLFPIHEYWLDIGQPSEFEKAQTDIGSQFNGK